MAKVKNEAFRNEELTSSRIGSPRKFGFMRE
jgi:hypothetical protein